MAQPHLDYRSRSDGSASPEWHTPGSSLPTRSTWLILYELVSRIIYGRVHRRYVPRRIAEPMDPKTSTSRPRVMLWHANTRDRGERGQFFSSVLSHHQTVMMSLGLRRRSVRTPIAGALGLSVSRRSHSAPGRRDGRVRARKWEPQSGRVAGRKRRTHPSQGC